MPPTPHANIPPPPVPPLPANVFRAALIQAGAAVQINEWIWDVERGGRIRRLFVRDGVVPPWDIEIICRRREIPLQPLIDFAATLSG